MKVSRKGFLRLDLAAGAGFSLLLGATVCSGDGEEVTGRLLASCRLFGGQEFATREGVNGANLAKIAGYASARALTNLSRGMRLTTALWEPPAATTDPSLAQIVHAREQPEVNSTLLLVRPVESQELRLCPPYESTPPSPR